MATRQKVGRSRVQTKALRHARTHTRWRIDHTVCHVQYNTGAPEWRFAGDQQYSLDATFRDEYCEKHSDECNGKIVTQCFPSPHGSREDSGGGSPSGDDPGCDTLSRGSSDMNSSVQSACHYAFKNNFQLEWGDRKGAPRAVSAEPHERDRTDTTPPVAGDGNEHRMENSDNRGCSPQLKCKIAARRCALIPTRCPEVVWTQITTRCMCAIVRVRSL